MWTTCKTFYIRDPEGWNSFNDQSQNCNCDDLGRKSERLEEELRQVEKEIGDERTKMAQELAGMRSSMTALLRRIEDLENNKSLINNTLCVATKEALHIPGCLKSME